jgi:hypothetical protein
LRSAEMRLQDMRSRDASVTPIRNHNTPGNHSPPALWRIDAKGRRSLTDGRALSQRLFGNITQPLDQGITVPVAEPSDANRAHKDGANAPGLR